MTTETKYELLAGLPPYGPMYISVSPSNDEPFYSEGYVLRLFKSDGTTWVANFRPGWTKYYNTFYLPDTNTLIVIAGGQGYVISPDDVKPKFTFGLTITDALQTSDGSVVCADDLCIFILDKLNGQLWVSERISWDGIKDLKLSNDTLHGQAYDPTNSIQPWSAFTINLKSKKVTGGTYRDFLARNAHLETGGNGILIEKTISSIKKKPWWKIWLL